MALSSVARKDLSRSRILQTKIFTQATNMERPTEQTTSKSKEKKGSHQNEVIKCLNQYQEHWGLDSNGNAVKEAMHRIQIDGTEADVQQDKLLLFLYAKGILAEKSSVVRVAEFKELLTGKTKKLEKALERLRTIVEIGETSPTSTPISPSPNPKSFFEVFVEKHPQWTVEDTFVVFRDHHNLKDKRHSLVERFQRSGLCYMHPPVVLQHYLVAMANDKLIPMLDMTKYMTHHMAATQLYNHIWENRGGDSFDFLQKILYDKLAFDDVILYSGRELLENANLYRNLETYGPALVSGFRVSEEFKETDLWHHTGKQADSFVGMHAMLLIGYRKFENEDGTMMIQYLLQNWWKSKAYIEVDIDFLASSGCYVRFITKKQSEIGSYPTNENVLVECDVDACEQFLPEGSL
jgi:hypothetical protein